MACISTERVQVHRKSMSSTRSSHLSTRQSGRMSVNESFQSSTSSRGRGRPSSIRSSKGRPRSSDSRRSGSSRIQSDRQSNQAESMSRPSESVSTRSRDSMPEIESQAEISLLKAEKHPNGKPKYRCFWFHWLLRSSEFNISPNALTELIGAMQQSIPYLEHIDVPSVSFLKSLRLSVDPLNYLQSQLFINDHDEYVLSYDDTPSR